MPTYNFKTKRQRWELFKKVLTCMWTGKLKIVQVTKPDPEEETPVYPMFKVTTMTSDRQHFRTDRNQWGFPDSQPHPPEFGETDIQKIIDDLDADIKSLRPGYQPDRPQR